MKDKPTKPQPFYSDSFKLGVVRRVANGELTKEQARLEYGIGGNSSILEWMKKFGYCSYINDVPSRTSSDGSGWLGHCSAYFFFLLSDWNQKGQYSLQTGKN